MTPEQIEFHRNIFEKWCKNNGHSIDGLQGAYLNLNTHRAWIAWIAAIESIEIELPMPVLYREEESPSERNHRYSYNTALNHAKQKIQLSYLRVKESWQ